MTNKELLKVENDFNVRQSVLGTEQRLKRSKDFYVWLEEQKLDVEESSDEIDEIQQMENRLFWSVIKEIQKANKTENTIKFTDFSESWDKSLTKSLYSFLDWHKENIAKKGGLIAVNKDSQRSFAILLTKLVKQARDADFFQMMYIYTQLYYNEVVDFKYIAYPKEEKDESKGHDTDDDVFNENKNELFKSEDEQPVFWQCIAKKQVTIQDCIDEKLSLDYLCWPRGSVGHQDYTAVLPPISSKKATDFDIHWDMTYKGETLRDIQERIVGKQPSQEGVVLTEEEKKEEEKKAYAEFKKIDVSWLVGSNEK